MKVQILIDEIRQARRDRGWSQRFLSERVGCSSQMIKRLEAGVGSVATLVAVMHALEFRLTGLGPGATLAEQLRNRRHKRGWSVAATATKTGLSPTTIHNLEGGGGTLASLMRLMEKLAPAARRRAPERAYWGAGDKMDRDSRISRGGLSISSTARQPASPHRSIARATRSGHCFPRPMARKFTRATSKSRSSARRQPKPACSLSSTCARSRRCSIAKKPGHPGSR